MNSDDQPSASATAVHRSSGRDGKQVVRIQNLTKRFRRNDGTRVDALADVSLTVYAGELLVLLGPSGCGKTTLLRSIAGLEQPDSGTISLGGTEVFNNAAKVNIPVERRDVAMVAQSYALWPNMTVLENIAYPLRSRPRRQRPAKAEILARVQELMETAGIAEIGRQHPSSISGGQQQRVALCRALVGDCQVVLFDEPLSNVDAKVREQLRRDLVEIQQKLKFTSVFVTHDRHEAMEIADEIAVFQNGRIAQQGPPAELYRSPASVYVADFLGPTNSAGARLSEPAPEGSVAAAETVLGTVRGIVRAPGERCVAVWRPERMRLSGGEHPLDGANCWAGVIERSCFYGTHTECFVTTAGPTLRVSVTGDVPYPAGAKIQVAVDTSDVVFLPDTEARQQ